MWRLIGYSSFGRVIPSRLNELEKENTRLKRLLADAELDKAILKEAASGEFCARRSGAPWSSTCVRCAGRSASRSVGPALNVGCEGQHRAR
jgi:hypothetical protein